jgi:hypothetical protein
MAASKISHEDFAKVLVEAWAAQTPGYESGGSITVLRPDGSKSSFSPVYGEGIATPWAISVDGNDNIWIVTLVINRRITESVWLQPLDLLFREPSDIKAG